MPAPMPGISAMVQPARINIQCTATRVRVPKQLRLIATNCYSSDTTTMNITVGNAPNGSLSNDSVVINIPCGTDSIAVAHHRKCYKRRKFNVEYRAHRYQLYFQSRFRRRLVRNIHFLKPRPSPSAIRAHVTNTGNGALMMSGYYQQ